MRFVQHLLDQSKLPLSVKQFWWYSLGYWSLFAIMTFGQLTLLWLLKEGEPMRYTETFIWFLDGLFWILTTPLILFASLKIPLVFKQRQNPLIKQIFYHVLIVTGLNLFINSFHYFVTNRIMFLAVGQDIPFEKYVLSFCISYTASFGQYMLLVVGFNKVSYIYRYQALQKEHFEVELANEQLLGKLANAQLESLKMQLNPHFLFNTLHAVVSLMIKNDVKKATLMIMTLSDLLRAVLVNHKSDYIPFGEELKLTQQYLSIQQIRFQDRMRVEYDIDPASELCCVPQLILQPLVENCITHGISELTTEALIRITSKVEGGHLKIEITDNGLGARPKKPSAGMGIGLKNTMLRLQQSFGKDALLHVNHPPEGGTIVTIQFQTKPNSKLLKNDNLSFSYN
jgi:sensor histidine kinase YesM